MAAAAPGLVLHTVASYDWEGGANASGKAYATTTL